ncbi:hypothetical protein LIER_16208 [Lithospermum erythrorhizon]|uniref:Cytochrome f large domain-containing protein n=1 Tax=Lithospermum erythrorhizon TaxID=34254 RepID=A0AAV3QAF3_LITER
MRSSLLLLLSFSSSNTYPIFAQQGYENPREATGRIVCANCHLANKRILGEAVSGDSPAESRMKGDPHVQIDR